MKSSVRLSKEAKRQQRIDNLPDANLRALVNAGKVASCTAIVYACKRFMGNLHEEARIGVQVRDLLYGMVLDGVKMAYLHVPNGGGRNRVNAAELKSQGVIAGAPDYLIMTASGVYCIELKKPKPPTERNPNPDPYKSLEEIQRYYREEMARVGIPYVVCTSVDEVKKQLNEWGIK